jgi:CBS domain-containing protein
MAEKHEKEQKSRETEAAGKGVGEAMGRAGRDTAETVQQGLRSAEEVGRRATEGASAVASHSITESGEVSRQLARQGAAAFSEATRQWAETAEQTLADLGTLLRFPDVAGEGVRQMQHAASGLVTRAMQNNARAVQDLFGMARPTEIIAMQHRFLEQYMKGLIDTSAEVLQVTRRLADQALEPLEETRGERQAEGSKVADVMTRDVEVADPNQSVRDAARLMAEKDTGALPVGENDRLVGMITDRDIALRVAAEGRDPQQTRVRDVMTADVRYVYEDEDVDHVADNMAEQKVRRLPVLNRSKRLVGVVSLGDIASQHGSYVAGHALQGIARPGGPHVTQSVHAGAKPGGRV